MGYVLYSVYSHAVRRQRPDGKGTLLVIAGSLGPDLVDKPLAWTFGVLPTGRTLGHSLLTAGLLVLLIAFLARRTKRSGVALPFGLGYLSAILTDVPPAVFSGDLSGATFLLWPLLPSPSYETEPSFLAHLQSIELTWFLVLQGALAALAVVLWILDDMPGVADLHDVRPSSRRR